MHCTARIESSDTTGFRSGRHPLDDYFARHALPNDVAGISRAYVLRRNERAEADLPAVLGFYTLSMASVATTELAAALTQRLPKYPLPVALVGRLAVDERARGRRLGERLLMDALHRVLDAAELVACMGIIVDAKDETAAGFYARYGFVALQTAAWPRRMFLQLATARAALCRS
jgi:GNAT superfamily N-acetyltransferase